MEKHGVECVAVCHTKHNRVRAYCWHVNAFLARILLAIHGLVCVQKSAGINVLVWPLCIPLAILPLEAWFTWVSNRGKEWTWFCPCITLYLMSVVPCIWIIELDIEKTYDPVSIIKRNKTGLAMNESVNITVAIPATDEDPDSHQFEKALFGRDWGMRTETLILEQLLLLTLIISRWILPKGHMTSDQKSSLLLAYLGISADILDLQSDIQEPKIRGSRACILMLLAVWSVSLMQFNFVLTARRAPPKQPPTNCGARILDVVLRTEVWVLLANVFMMELPFMTMRLYLIFGRASISPSGVFFTVKNSFMTVMLLYRVYGIVYDERRNRAAKAESETLAFNSADAEV